MIIIIGIVVFVVIAETRTSRVHIYHGDACDRYRGAREEGFNFLINKSVCAPCPRCRFSLTEEYPNTLTRAGSIYTITRDINCFIYKPTLM
jgi:hypothetical protein